MAIVPKVVWYFVFFKYIIQNVWDNIRIYFIHFRSKYLQISMMDTIRFIFIK